MATTQCTNAADAYALAVKCANAEDAVALLWEKVPQDMIRNGRRIKANIVNKFSPARPYDQKRYYGPYPKEFYPVGWDREKHSLLIVGPSGVGKTQFARYLLGDCDYIKDELDPALKSCKFDKPLLFDDIDMLRADPSQSSEITDVENGGTIEMRYANVTIPFGVPRIFLHCMEYPFRDPRAAVYGRRVVTHVISGPCADAANAVIAARIAEVGALLT